jgi:pre-mRNA-splicing helicase BRR2
MWASQNPLRQFKVLSPELLGRLEKKDLAWERYYDLSAGELGELVRAPKMGKTLVRGGEGGGMGREKGRGGGR